MTPRRLDRRELLTTTGILAAGTALTRTGSVGPAVAPFRYCLNTSTIRGQRPGLEQEIDIAGKAGYDAIEPWLAGLHRYVEGGGKLGDLRKRLADRGLTVESGIGFAQWIVDDDAARNRGLEQARRDMDAIAKLGGRRIAAPPAGAPRDRAIDPRRIAERYRRLLELGDEAGVVPQIEMWGGNRSIGKVSTAIAIAIESGHPKACFLGDVYHIYKGGSDFTGLRLLGPQALQVFHMNDYPADPQRETIRDEHRVYPGDGVAPLAEVIRGFRAAGAAPVLSLELFNKSYWQQDPLAVAKTGLGKMRAAVARAGG